MPFPILPNFPAAFVRLIFSTLLALCAIGPVHAQEPVNPKGAPADFVKAVSNNALDAVKQKKGSQTITVAAINEIVNQYVLPYVNLEKTTQLSAGRYWRQASAQQQQALIQAFKGTLIRTYSGAFNQVDSRSAFQMQPFRGDASADDVVVRSTLTQGNRPSVGIDYRLEKTPAGWKIYDLNVEGIWLIQNYRNQFAQEISQGGIDGLIQTLNQRNK